MGKKLDKAYYEILAETRHHTKLSIKRGDPYEIGFANGFAEALRIIAKVRNELEDNFVIQAIDKRIAETGK
jgi:hypothetical protein